MYVNGGHDPAMLVRASGKVERLDVGGPILGILPQARYETGEGQLNCGDVLVIFSDGVTEAPSPGSMEEFSDSRLEELVVRHHNSAAGDIQAAVVRALGEWTGDNGAADDVTLVVARRVAAAQAAFDNPTGG
jgi:sigma-B regulation protein RsbU (phosphoserine phosphatase)